MKIIYTLISFCLVVASGFTQDEVLTVEKSYDIPPGAVITKKADLTKDYSYLLEDLNNSTTEKNEKADFIRNFSDKELTSLESKDVRKFDYYSRAKQWYDSLSDKILYTFSTEQLWYVYQFDLELRQQLTKY